MILKLIKLYIVEVTRLLSQKNHCICLCRFKVISIFVKFIGNFLTLLRQSWPLMLGHLTLPTPLNQCCNQTWYAMKFARRVHSNTTLKGGEGRMELEYLKKLNYVQVSQLFLSKIVAFYMHIGMQECQPAHLNITKVNGVRTTYIYQL